MPQVNVHGTVGDLGLVNEVNSSCPTDTAHMKKIWLQ